MPIVLEDSHGSVRGTSSLTLNLDGTRIYLASGQALATDTFHEVAEFPGGTSALSADGTKLLINDGEADAGGVYDTFTTGKLGRREWGCDILNLVTLKELGSDGITALGDGLVCFSGKANFP